jgi:hypothetical protein
MTTYTGCTSVSFRRTGKRIVNSAGVMMVRRRRQHCARNTNLDPSSPAHLAPPRGFAAIHHGDVGDLGPRGEEWLRQVTRSFGRNTPKTKQMLRQNRDTSDVRQVVEEMRKKTTMVEWSSGIQDLCLCPRVCRQVGRYDVAQPEITSKEKPQTWWLGKCSRATILLR